MSERGIKLGTFLSQKRCRNRLATNCFRKAGIPSVIQEQAVVEFENPIQVVADEIQTDLETLRM